MKRVVGERGRKSWSVESEVERGKREKEKTKKKEKRASERVSK